MKEPRNDATLKMLPEAAQEELWLLHRPEDGEGEPLGWGSMLAEIESRHGLSVGKTTFYEWRSWYALRRRLRRARERARQAELEAAAEGTLDPAAIARVGQAAFTSEAVSGENVKAFVMLEKLRLKQRELEHDERKLKLLEEKARRAEEAKKALEERRDLGGLSDESLELIERTLGML